MSETGDVGGDGVRLVLGDCVERMGEIPDGSVDAIICDPPYPEIDRPYGRMTETDWWSMMMGVCRESRRVLKPTGSAVFILQPNSRKVGSMRGWLFRFQAWACDEWNMVQDAYWWNTTALPSCGGSDRKNGLMRPSVKPSVWLGDPECYRDQDAVLWTKSELTTVSRHQGRFVRSSPSGRTVHNDRMERTSIERGGVVPFNLMPVQNDRRGGGHSAATPFDLCDWWVRYISPEGGLICDPFMGSGTTGLAALNRGRKFIGIERDPGYFATAEHRIAEHRAATPLLA